MQEKTISIIDAMLHPFECLNKLFCDEGAVFFYQVLVYDISNIIYILGKLLLFEAF